MDACRPVRRRLAEGPVCLVEECSCGVLHVTLGVLTIRLRPEVVASFTETLAAALDRLSGSPARPRDGAQESGRLVS